MERDDVCSFRPAPLPPRSASDAGGRPERTLASTDPTTRAGQVLALLDFDIRGMRRQFEVEIVEARAAGPDTVEIIYRRLVTEGLVGLRRDVSEQEADLSPEDPFHALAVNESSPREMAAMLRVELEEPLGRTRLMPDAHGIQWWGDPASYGPS